MNAAQLLERIKEVNVKEIALNLYEGYAPEFTKAVKKQLWMGQKPDGSDITPSYLDDPYFKTKKQAEAYANWKMKIGRNSGRNKYAPNLYINGYFYSTLTFKVSEHPTIESSWAEVGNKYRDALGVSIEHKNEIAQKMLPDWQATISGITGLAFN